MSQQMIRSLDETLRRFRNHGISSDARQRQASGQWYYEMVAAGIQLPASDIVCALGIEQLKKLDGNLARRREIAKPLHSVVCGNSGCDSAHP